ncbi:MAG: SDR family NAD(P)-dependent oxidoreductase [Pseudomonadota bacterium]
MAGLTRVTLVTGASQGIGRACAERLASAGHKVVGLARRPAGAFPGDFLAVDLADRAATSAVLAELSRRYAFNGLLNNVGLVSPQAFGGVDLEVVDRVIEVNMVAALQCTQACVPAMKAQRFGRIVNTSSEVVLGLAGRTAYAAAKAGLISFTRTWALERGRDGITVNAVAPGAVDTEGFAKNNPIGSAERDRKIARIPVGRIGRPEDIAGAEECVDPDGKERPPGDQRELRHLADAEPDDRQWDERDRRDRAQPMQDRIGDVAQRQEPRREQPHDDPQNRAVGEAPQGAAEARQDVHEQLARGHEIDRRIDDP